MSHREPSELTSRQRYEETVKFAEYLGRLGLILEKHFEEEEFWLGNIFVQYKNEGLQLTLEDGRKLSDSAQSTPEEKNELLAKMVEINELMKARVEKEIAFATAQGLDTKRLEELNLLISQRPEETIRVARLRDIPKLKWGPDKASHAAGLPQAEEVKGLTSTTGDAALAVLGQNEK